MRTAATRIPLETGKQANSVPYHVTPNLEPVCKVHYDDDSTVAELGTVYFFACSMY